MAYMEYPKLIRRAKLGSKFVVYTLDGMQRDEFDNAYTYFLDKTLNLMSDLKYYFLELEKQTGQKILVRDKDIYVDQKDVNSLRIGSFSRYNPNFTNGDFLSFYFYSDVITDEMFFNAFAECTKKEKNYFPYRFAKNNYETNNYTEREKKYWLGDAQQYLVDKKGKNIDCVDLVVNERYVVENGFRRNNSKDDNNDFQE